MEAIITSSFFLLIILILSAPILLYLYLKKKEHKSVILKYFIGGVILSFALMTLFAWWGDKSDIILLNYYGFNSEGMSEIESYQNVLPENIEKVKSIRMSMMGVGWPVKAIFGIIMYLPFLGLLLIINKIIYGLINLKNKA